MTQTLLMPRELDRILRYPRGRSLRLAKLGKIPCVRLPDGEVRFRPADLEFLLSSTAKGSEAVANAH